MSCPNRYLTGLKSPFGFCFKLIVDLVNRQKNSIILDFLQHSALNGNYDDTMIAAGEPQVSAASLRTIKTFIIQNFHDDNFVQVYIPHGKQILEQYENSSYRRTSAFNMSLESQVCCF